MIAGNPLYGGAEGAAAGALYSRLIINGKTTRREAVKILALSVVGLGIAGIITGWDEREIYKGWLTELEQNAKYLDRIYTSTQIR